jgi:hypothetical protein
VSAWWLAASGLVLQMTQNIDRHIAAQSFLLMILSASRITIALEAAKKPLVDEDVSAEQTRQSPVGKLDR